MKRVQFDYVNDVVEIQTLLPLRQFHLDWTKTEDIPIDEFNALNILHISTVFQRITFLASAMINWIEASLSNIDFYIHICLYSILSRL